MAKAKDKNGSVNGDQDVPGPYHTDGSPETAFERTVASLSGDSDLQSAYVSAIAMRTMGFLLTKMAPDAERRTFYVDSTTRDFTHWLVTKVAQRREVPTREGFYEVTLDYPELDYLLNLRPDARALVQEVMLSVDHVPPSASKPPGGIAFKSDRVRADRIEVTAISNIPEVSPIFHEILQQIGTAYPESGLAVVQTNRGGRPATGTHTAEHLRVIKRVGELRSQGLSHAQVGVQVKLTRSRVSQICRENGFEKGVKGN